MNLKLFLVEFGAGIVKINEKIAKLKIWDTVYF